MSYFCSFIVPTIGRETLPRALQSIIAQTDPDWNAHIIGDGLGPKWMPPWLHQRFLFSNTTAKLGSGNKAGIVRDHGFSTANGHWFGFVDDDDRLDPHYVEWLREEGVNKDIVVFRMKLGDGTVLPCCDQLQPGNVGISFAVRAEFQRSNNLWFIASPIEDWTFLEHAMTFGARIKVSKRIAYYVRH